MLMSHLNAQFNLYSDTRLVSHWSTATDRKKLKNEIETKKGDFTLSSVANVLCYNLAHVTIS